MLIAPGDNSGSGKFRCIDPHVNLQNNFSEDFFIDINYDIDFSNISFLKKYDAVFIHLNLLRQKNKEAISIINNLKKLDIKVIVDIDDHWELDPSHGYYQSAKLDNLLSISIECIKLADMVTTTTDTLRNVIKVYNKNVVILPNAINPNEEQFKIKKTESDLIRFGWLGGSTHTKDIELLSDFSAAQKSLPKKTQIVLCGFNPKGIVQTRNPQTGEIETTPMKPQESSWFMYELFLTNNYKNLENDPEYLKYLVSFIDDPNYNTTNKLYRRVWTKPITQYGTGYNQFDISLIPLNVSKFNSYKSQLKVIEAGFHKKAVIAQNYGPYTIDLINSVDKGGGWNNNGNALMVEPSKNHKQWFKYAKKLTENPNLITELGEKLYETVKEKYNLNNVTKNRSEYYKKLLK